MERGKGRVMFSGPESYATKKLPTQFLSQRALTPKQIRDADLQVGEHERLPLVATALKSEPSFEWTVDLDGALTDNLRASMLDDAPMPQRFDAKQHEIALKVERLLHATQMLEEEIARLKQQLIEIERSDDDHDGLKGAVVNHLQVSTGSRNDLKGLKVEIFANEHPPPHFGVKFQSSTANFRISDCRCINGSREVMRYERNIRLWWKKHKQDLIEAWNRFRPADYPVGPYKE